VFSSRWRLLRVETKRRMPRFAAALSDEQILDVIAWFQSHWPDEIYAAWSKAEERARQAGQ